MKRILRFIPRSLTISVFMILIREEEQNGIMTIYGIYSFNF